MYKYNYVFFWHDADYYRYAFSEILGFENVIFINKLIPDEKPFIQMLNRVHNSAKLNNIVKLPGRKLWSDVYFNDSFTKKKPIVFIFNSEYYRLRSIDYFSYLRGKYPGCKCIMFLTDTVDRYKYSFSGKFYGDYDIEYIKNNFDMVISYNMSDVERYGLTYYPLIYSNVSTECVDITSDVFFVGRAKDRLDLLHSIYLQLVSAGFRCDFYITKVENEQMLEKSGIKYNHKLDYKQVIDHINSSNAILEIVQGGSNGFTLRLDEALVFNKVLITNNPIVDTIPYSNSPKIIRISDKINFTRDDFVKRCAGNFDYKGEYSPKNLLSFLERSFAA